MTVSQTSTDHTRERLLVEAEKLFATKGYAAVSVREITTAAETNTAAINYHFGGKKNLYIEVFRQRWLPRAHKTMASVHALLDEPDLTLEKIIRTAIAAFWSGPLSHSSEEFALHGSLIHRELHNRTEAWDIIVGEAVRPFYDLMYQLVHRVRPEAQRHEVMLSCMSLFSQLVFFSHARPIAMQVLGEQAHGDLESLLTEHITSFCLNGMNANGDHPCDASC